MRATPARVIARITAGAPGPTLVCIGGIHGNEPAGVTALQRVESCLRSNSGIVRGQFLALTGNRAALAQGERFVDRDLNRNWRTLGAPSGRGGGVPQRVEDTEQEELAREIHRAIDEARGDVYLVDLHTTSGQGKPFSVIADSLPSRRFALQFPNPLVLGLEGHLDGTLVDCVTSAGHAAVAFEGGMTTDESSVDHLEAAVLSALEVTRLRDTPFALGGSTPRATLEAAAKGLPQIVEMRYHHAILPRDRFVMKEGWSGFDTVEMGQELASDATGTVVAPESGYLLMPLYQAQGFEGFFVVRPVRQRDPPNV